MKTISIFGLVLLFFFFNSCTQNKEESSSTAKDEKIAEQPQTETQSNSLTKQNGSDWQRKFVRFEFVYFREKPESTSKALGYLVLGDSIFINPTFQDSLWASFIYKTDTAFIPRAFLNDKKLMGVNELKTNLASVFSNNANVWYNANTKGISYPVKKVKVIVPKNVSLIELGYAAYPEIKEIEKKYGFGGVKTCAEFSADKSLYYQTTADKNVSITFQSLGALNLELVSLKSGQENIAARVANGDVKFIKAEIK